MIQTDVETDTTTELYLNMALLLLSVAICTLAVRCKWALEMLHCERGVWWLSSGVLCYNNPSRAATSWWQPWGCALEWLPTKSAVSLLTQITHSLNLLKTHHIGPIKPCIFTQYLSAFKQLEFCKVAEKTSGADTRAASPTREKCRKGSGLLRREFWLPEKKKAIGKYFSKLLFNWSRQILESNCYFPKRF